MKATDEAAREKRKSRKCILSAVLSNSFSFLDQDDIVHYILYDGNVFASSCKLTRSSHPYTDARTHTQSPVDETNNIAVNVRAYASANAFNRAVRRCGFSLLN